MSENVVIRDYRGIRKLVACELIADNESTLLYDISGQKSNVFPIAGIASLTRDTESSSDVKYYDNKPQFAVDSVGADTVTCECSAVPLEVIARLTGQNYDEETKMLLESSTAKKPYFAIGYITSDTNGDDVYVWRYKCKVASIPSEEHKTKDASTDSNGQQLVFTCFETVHKSELTGESFKSAVHKADSTISEEEFFRAVMTPDSIAAKYKTTSASEG